MKIKAFLFFFLLFFSQLAWGQKKIWPIVGVYPNLSLQKTTFRLYASPIFGLQSNRHSIELGPVIFLKNFPSAHEKPRISGGQGSYRYQLSKNEKSSFRYFLEISSRVQSFKEEWISNYWNENLQKYQDIKMGSRENLWENNLGFGFAKQLHDQLELQVKGAAGYYFSSIKPLGEGYSLPDPEEYDYRFYRKNGLVFSVGLGLVYQFK